MSKDSGEWKIPPMGIGTRSDRHAEHSAESQNTLNWGKNGTHPNVERTPEVEAPPREVESVQCRGIAPFEEGKFFFN